MSQNNTISLSRIKRVMKTFQKAGLKGTWMSSKPIAGSISLDVPDTTHQADLRIRQKTSFEKFVMEHPNLGGVPLLRLWMKQLFVGRSANSKAEKLKAVYKSTLLRFKPQEPMDGALRLDLVITYPRKQKHKTKKLLNYEYLLRTTKPDIDNAAKTFVDALTETGIIVDDARIARMVLEKRFGDNPGIQFRVSYMEPGKLKRTMLDKPAPFA